MIPPMFDRCTHSQIDSEVLHLIIDTQAKIQGKKPVKEINQERLCKLEEFAKELEECSKRFSNRRKTSLHAEAMKYLYWLQDQLTWQGWESRVKNEDLTSWFKLSENLQSCRTQMVHY